MMPQDVEGVQPMRITNRLLILALACTCLFAGSARGQHQHENPSSSATATPLTGLGNHHHRVSTSNDEAQRFFDQGLSLIYAFNHEEGAKAFRRAAELDPNLAMAYWGIALAVGPNYNEPQIDPERMKTAVEALRKAKSLETHATEIERGYVDALTKRFSLDPAADLKILYRAYKDAMGELHRRFPDDLDAATLYADSLMNLNPWQLWDKSGKPADGTEEAVAILEGVLARDPDHLGANHLYIHVVEASPYPERALASAKRLETAAPAAGHLVHMPGHIYLRTGDFAASARTNEAAAEADRSYIRKTGAKGMYVAMYYSHNLHFLVESYGRMGLHREALRAAEALADNARLHVKEMPMIEGFLPSVMFVGLRFARWDDVLKIQRPDATFALTSTVWHYARGVALAEKGQVREAEAERKALGEKSKGLPGETPFGLNSAASVLAVAENVLDARIAWAKGEKRAAIKYWGQAVAAQDALNYDEPPGWYYSVRESLGAAMLLNGDAAGAEAIFRADLKANPRNGRSLFGLAESLRRQGKNDAARLVQTEFEKAWRAADTKLRIEDL
jgi:tetratricopeptide (TPR) repeat protein